MNIEEMEDIVEKVWRNKVRDDWNEGKIQSESNLRDSLYYWLKEWLKQHPDHKIYINKNYKKRDSAQKEDPIQISIELNGEPWFVFETKFESEILPCVAQIARYKIRRMKQYYGARRGYFCFIEYRSKRIETRGHNFVSGRGKWEKNYYREAQGTLSGEKKHWNIVKQ